MRRAVSEMGLAQDELDRQRKAFRKIWEKRFAIGIDDVLIDEFLRALKGGV